MLVPLILFLLTAPPSQQQHTRPAKTTTPSKTAAVAKSSPEVDAARAALTAGHVDDAIAAADRILAKTPTDEDAARVKIDALMTRGDHRQEALDAYDKFQIAAKRGSATLLAPIARGELRALTHNDLPSTQGDALGALAADGDRAARQQLEKLATDPKSAASGAAIAADEALARLGDAPAGQRLMAAAAQLDPARRAMLLRDIASIPHAPKPAASLVRESLQSPDPMAQMTAANLAATFGLTELEPDLRQVAANGHPMVRNDATLALMRLGDAASKETIRKQLSSPVPAVQLQAARAFAAVGEKNWVVAVRPLLGNLDGLTRFSAAELMLPVDRHAALDVLQEGLTDQNPTIRTEAARIMTADGQVDPTLLRKLLTDAAPRARLLAASAVLSQARAPQ
jgi:hypothetical protein